MSVVRSISAAKNKKRAEELRTFIVEIDTICDTLYSRLKFDGVWETIMKLEDVRVRYYIEYHDCQQAIEGKLK